MQWIFCAIMDNLPPPAPLSFTGVVAQNFKQFEQAYQIYMIATGLDKKDNKIRANVLLHIIGPEALKVYNGFSWAEAEGDTPAEDKENPSHILKKFKEYCTPKKNTIYERHLFNNRSQQQGETFDQFYSDLCQLSQTCDFDTMADQMIRDRIVVGIYNPGLRERLLRLGEGLTLTKAVDVCRAWEATSSQVDSFKNSQGQKHSVDAVFRGKTASSHGRGRGQGTRVQNTSGQHNPGQNSLGRGHQGHNTFRKPNGKCKWCGFENHDRKSCPAREASCHYCHSLGHFKSVCRKRNKRLHYVTESGDSSDFLGYLTKDMGGISSSVPQHDVIVKLDGIPVSFRADTGADVTIISKDTFDDQFGDKLLRKSSSKLRGPDLKEIKICGYFNTDIKYGTHSISTEVYVLPNSAQLLSREVCEKLGLINFNMPKQIGHIQQDVVQKYPQLFNGLGKLQTEYDITISPDATPYAVHSPRRISLPLHKKVKAELERLQSLGVITPVTEPTPWCAPIVVVPKSSGDVRICVDLTKLNAAVCRERHILPSVEHLLGQMAGASVFSKIDANSGFHQIPLSKRSQLLTTFITPFGRFAYQRLPFGITSGPELFQREMQNTLEGLGGVVCLMDDIVVYGQNRAEHDQRLEAVLNKLHKSGITLNKDKCAFYQEELEFIGQVVGKNGISASPKKTAALLEMPEPQNIHELRRFLGMVNQLGKFVPNLSEKTDPLRSLLSKQNAWVWGPAQDKAFQQVKQTLTTTPTLALYDVHLPTKVTADSSSYGIGAVIMQQHPEGWRPVAYASRTLTITEKRYAQIEKEALAVTWACEKFEDYILGLNFTLETDHKPLVPLLGHRDVELLPPRLQRFRLRLMRYSYVIQHVPGCELYTADTLSRTPLSSTADQSFETETNSFVNSVISCLPASDVRLEQIRSHQKEDETCRLLMSYCQDGWPDRNKLHGTINQYWPFRSELTMVDGLLLRGSRIIIPSSLRLEILDSLHEGHQGISKCRSRAQQSVWWPGLSTQIAELIQNCRHCSQFAKNHPEPLETTQFPDSPWSKVASDLFEYKQKNYLLVVDYYSRYIEIAKLDETTASCVIQHLKSMFARHGIPQCLKSDNGPQYACREFKDFAQSYGFLHVTSSPGHPSSNGEAERAVRTIKQLLRGSTDPYAALMNYRATPLSNGHSPAELLMSRRIRTKVPIPSTSLKPRLPSEQLQDRESEYRQKMKSTFDHRHAAKTLPYLEEGQEVYIPDRKQFGNVQDKQTDRSYVVKTPTGTYRRNRIQLNSMPAARDHSVEKAPVCPIPRVTDSKVEAQPQPHTQPVNSKVTRSGRIVKPPLRFQECA